MDIDEIKEHIHKLRCGSTDWQSVEKLAALCTVRDELEENRVVQHEEAKENIQAYSGSVAPANSKSEFVAAASAAPFGGLMDVLDEHMSAIKMVYPKEYELVMKKIKLLD